MSSIPQRQVGVSRPGIGYPHSTSLNNTNDNFQQQHPPSSQLPQRHGIAPIPRTAPRGGVNITQPPTIQRQPLGIHPQSLNNQQQQQSTPTVRSGNGGTLLTPQLRTIPNSTFNNPTQISQRQPLKIQPPSAGRIGTLPNPSPRDTPQKNTTSHFNINNTQHPTPLRNGHITPRNGRVEPSRLFSTPQKQSQTNLGLGNNTNSKIHQQQSQNTHNNSNNNTKKTHNSQPPHKPLIFSNIIQLLPLTPTHYKRYYEYLIHKQPTVINSLKFWHSQINTMIIAKLYEINDVLEIHQYNKEFTLSQHFDIRSDSDDIGNNNNNNTGFAINKGNNNNNSTITTKQNNSQPLPHVILHAIHEIDQCSEFSTKTNKISLYITYFNEVNNILQNVMDAIIEIFGIISYSWTHKFHNSALYQQLYDLNLKKNNIAFSDLPGYDGIPLTKCKHNRSIRFNNIVDVQEYNLTDIEKAQKSDVIRQELEQQQQQQRERMSRRSEGCDDNRDDDDDDDNNNNNCFGVGKKIMIPPTPQVQGRHVPRIPATTNTDNNNNNTNTNNRYGTTSTLGRGISPTRFDQDNNNYEMSLGYTGNNNNNNNIKNNNNSSTPPQPATTDQPEGIQPSPTASDGHAMRFDNDTDTSTTVNIYYSTRRRRTSMFATNPESFDDKTTELTQNGILPLQKKNKNNVLLLEHIFRSIYKNFDYKKNNIITLYFQIILVLYRYAFKLGEAVVGFLWCGVDFDEYLEFQQNTLLTPSSYRINDLNNNAVATTNTTTLPPPPPKNRFKQHYVGQCHGQLLPYVIHNQVNQYYGGFTGNNYNNNSTTSISSSISTQYRGVELEYNDVILTSQIYQQIIMLYKTCHGKTHINQWFVLNNNNTTQKHIINDYNIIHSARNDEIVLKDIYDLLQPTSVHVQQQQQQQQQNQNNFFSSSSQSTTGRNNNPIDNNNNNANIPISTLLPNNVQIVPYYIVKAGMLPTQTNEYLPTKGILCKLQPVTHNNNNKTNNNLNNHNNTTQPITSSFLPSCNLTPRHTAPHILNFELIHAGYSNIQENDGTNNNNNNNNITSKTHLSSSSNITMPKIYPVLNNVMIPIESSSSSSSSSANNNNNNNNTTQKSSTSINNSNSIDKPCRIEFGYIKSIEFKLPYNVYYNTPASSSSTTTTTASSQQKSMNDIDTINTNNNTSCNNPYQLPQRRRAHMMVKPFCVDFIKILEEIKISYLYSLYCIDYMTFVQRVLYRQQLFQRQQQIRQQQQIENKNKINNTTSIMMQQQRPQQLNNNSNKNTQQTTSFVHNIPSDIQQLYHYSDIYSFNNYFNIFENNNNTNNIHQNLINNTSSPSPTDPSNTKKRSCLVPQYTKCIDMLNTSTTTATSTTTSTTQLKSSPSCVTSQLILLNTILSYVYKTIQQQQQQQQQACHPVDGRNTNNNIDNNINNNNNNINNNNTTTNKYYRMGYTLIINGYCRVVDMVTNKTYTTYDNVVIHDLDNNHTNNNNNANNNSTTSHHYHHHITPLVISLIIIASFHHIARLGVIMNNTIATKNNFLFSSSSSPK